MTTFHPVNPHDWNHSVFRKFARDWVAITSEGPKGPNAMTASWGGLGQMWDRPVAFVVVRKSRHTHELLNNSHGFSLAFFPDEPGFRKILGELGRLSGRNQDKLGPLGLKVDHFDGVPYLPSASTVLVCTKLFAQNLPVNLILDPIIEPRCYPEGDEHTLFIAEITKILERD